MKRQVVGLFIACFLFTNLTKGQEYGVEDVRNAVSPRNFGTIADNNNEISGYYFFYKTEKVDRKNNGYEIRILDADLNLVATENIVEGKRTLLTETAYNGEYLLFKFVDYKEKEVKYRVMNKNGKISRGTTRELDKHEMRTYLSEDGDAIQLSIFAPNGEGFIDIYQLSDKGIKYNITRISNAGSIEWTYTAPIEKRSVKSGSFLMGSENSFLILETNSKSIFSKDFTFTLAGMSYEGEELFNVPLESRLFNLMPHNAFYDEEKGIYTLIGEHYNKSEKMVKAESEGVFVREINDGGLWESEVFMNWERDIKPKMTAEEYKDAKKFHVYFHDVIMTKEGNIIAIGEQYKKQVSALGVASNMLNSGSEVSNLEIRIGDMIMLEIDNELELDDVYIFDKKNNSELLPSGWGLLNTHLLGKMMGAYGYFDYEFNQFNTDGSVNTIAFSDRVKEDGKLLKQSVVQLVSYVDMDGEFTKDQVTIPTDADGLWVDRGKPGFITVYEYFRRDRKAAFHLEPINF